MKVKKKYLILALALLPLLAYASHYLPFPRKRLQEAPVISLRLVDRNNILLREVLSDEGGRCRWVHLEDVSPYLAKATVVAEDKYFYHHDGFNPVALARALYLNLKSRSIISGASTITQQLVRNIYRFPRTFLSKIAETWLALRLENSLTKNEILVQYLNRISYGNQAIGIDAASRLYFEKPSADLSLAEAAFLAGLPRSPVQLNPYRSLPQAVKRQREILMKMHDQRLISSEELDRAIAEEINLCSEREKFRAPHFCDYILGLFSARERRGFSLIQTSIDYHLQEKVEAILKSRLNSLESLDVSNGAAVVMDNVTGEILCLVGSRDFFDETHHGQVNGALSLRQPGSALKPFTYALAFERGLTPATVIEDIETQFTTPEGSYEPQNYDLRFHGPVRARSALACSYNIPAVSLLSKLGSDMLYQRLKMLGFESLKKSPGFYGIGLTLGNGEVTLLELVRAYATLARGGLTIRENPLLRINDDRREDLEWNAQLLRHRQVFSAQVAYIITNILSDRDARIPSFGYLSPISLPFACAAKTGTSKDFRDNWTVGYSPRYTVGVWVGNFDGKPMHNVSGITGCGPLFRDIMLLLEKGGDQGEFEEPPGLVRVKVCPLSGKLPGQDCRGVIEEVFVEGTEPRQTCLAHRDRKDLSQMVEILSSRTAPPEAAIAVVFPQDGDEFKIDPVLRREYQTVKLKARIPECTGIESIEWWLNGEKIGSSPFPFSFSWTLKPGSYTIKAKAFRENRMVESREVRVRVLS